MEGTKQKVVLSILVAKSRGIWGKSGKIRKGQMAKPRVLAITVKKILGSATVRGGLKVS
ncbi:hypothetical protein HanHA300_Chr14g0512391 [Helianthus annuus]|nr:hypothetical protein HanHA300_Chr14g0512391 [Helianthus annuus]KAJ0484558.1 hypothetical protein HanHA89_Chr14g0545461 [Helianthus annuus]KAJ0655113.1 hypothetical protein HanLR1_Chr14g0514751 [Helianthus annuus]KAJ0658822.1 hypothetical protein HanOQP8_Chr14g0512541 [Helianthus annuus]